MSFTKGFNLRNSAPYFYAFLLVHSAGAIGQSMRNWLDYHSIGYLYLLSVLFTSAFFEKGPIFFSAILSALAWNFFFMPPRFSFQIGTSQDMLMYYTYFFVASLGGYLNSRIRKHEKLLASKEEAERLYQTLINSISHEIRTPLTAIVGNASALQNEALLVDQDFLRNTVKELHHASLRLNHVVENLLDMSRIESGRLVLKHEVFSALELVETVTEKMAPTLSKHLLRIHSEKISDFDDLISGDFRLLEHVIENLILNATHYSPPNTEITINVKSLSHTVIVSISNHGPKIGDEFKEKIFEKFFRLPGTPAGGVGLGLSIVRGILAAHSAKVRAADVSDGACFEIEFLKANLPENVRRQLI